MSGFTSKKTKVSKQVQNNRMHVIEWNKSIMYSNQSINESITYVGPPLKPDLFLHKLIP